MPYIDVHIDVDEFYDQLDRIDKKQLVTYLQQDDILKEHGLIAYDSNELEQGSVLDHEWVDMMNKLNQSRYILTPDQEKILRNLINQL
jgi:hypothetical protein